MVIGSMQVVPEWSSALCRWCRNGHRLYTGDAKGFFVFFCVSVWEVGAHQLLSRAARPLPPLPPRSAPRLRSSLRALAAVRMVLPERLPAAGSVVSGIQTSAGERSGTEAGLKVCPMMTSSSESLLPVEEASSSRSNTKPASSEVELAVEAVSSSLSDSSLAVEAVSSSSSSSEAGRAAAVAAAVAAASSFRALDHRLPIERKAEA